MTATERAAEGQKNPLECLFYGISHSDPSEIDRMAMWTVCREHTLQYRDSTAVIAFRRLAAVDTKFHQVRNTRLAGAKNIVRAGLAGTQHRHC